MDLNSKISMASLLNYLSQLKIMPFFYDESEISEENLESSISYLEEIKTGKCYIEKK